MKYLKLKLTNWVLNSVIKGFDYEEIDSKLSDEDKIRMGMKAKEYLADEDWIKFEKMLKNQALNKMGTESVNQTDMMFAKMVLFFKQLRETKLKEWISNAENIKEPEEEKKW